MATEHSFILKLACADRPGIVHAVSGFLFERGSNILDSAQFGDSRTGEFFMRVHFQQVGGDPGLHALRASFATLAEQFGMRWELHDANVKSRVMIMVSKIGHCLNDLLFRYRTGQLAIEIPAIVSNHQDFYQLAASYNIPFHYLPLADGTPQAKAAQESRVLELVEHHGVDLVVLARYMQILSGELCEKLAGRAINIHHSFLPSFKGAKPYYQAFDRGVKLIGATAHYVTTDLDEGPIIEQEVERVDHSMTPDELTAVGRDVECVTLARAVKWHVEHRIVLNDTKTVVFR
ncbi:MULTISPECIES: formyltetrahydrofolate deformylase [Burkholderiaceae]|uniref:formyltetrahydrofolate deformylase n=1 Tax=Burkholderiaceae TaxID=119060 RepID=UPI00095D6F8E|nr:MULTISPECIES: formyltetrahydrofolate deformylase [Burkholderiaceae]MCG1019445.1 formyltetrahydrofolate deformylase [Mycetohabitans sp. B4]MCG1040250.1 formyltetrahydrofolate deformylase [Mycetohabitans sp. B7]SIT72066.1 formyltetrahydrofolate deformylase [Burkholderia sp. b13]SIT73394.1 formyltetrahydrofolate deformylase [Burkholderia sp. b14]